MAEAGAILHLPARCFEELNELFAIDVTDDFEELSILDSEIDEEILEAPDKHFENVSKDELVIVLSRISDRDCNNLDEASLAERVLTNIEEQEANILSFLKTIQTSFSSFHNVKVKAKQERSIRIEQNFLKDSPERIQIQQSGKSWSKLVEFVATKIRRLFWNMCCFIFGS